MSALKFGDFDGDGVTDVLAVEGGRWAISSGAAQPWRRINSSLGDGVARLYVADVDHNNKDDLLRLNLELSKKDVLRSSWEISYDGATPWRPLKSYEWSVFGKPLIFGFAGRFGTAPGAGVLTIDQSGLGHFYAPLETRAGAKPDWTSTFRY
jgi:hypothetical protein